MSFTAMKTLIATLQEEDYRAFVKALISLETGKINEEELNNICDRFMKDNMETLINPIFY